MEKIIKNKVKDTKTLTLQAFLDDFTFNTLKDANKRDVTKLKNAMRKRGWTSPVFTWNSFVVDGTGRRKAVVELLEEGYTFPEGIPYVEVEAKDMAEAKQLALDFSSQHGYITKDSFLEYTADFEVDFETMQIAGFDKDKFIDTNENDDDVPDVATQGEPLTSAGDIYELGAHRVLCGDSTKLEDVERLMDGKKADMVFTSPPYNANTKAGQGDIFNGKASKKLYADGYSDNLAPDEYVKFAQDVLMMCFAFTEGFIFWNVSYNKNSRYQYIQQITPWLEYLLEQICWKKSSTIPFKGSMMRDWEPIYLFSTMKANLGLDKVTSNFWEVSNTGAQQENHKACFPVELVVRGIETINGSNLLFDPFLGSGSTLIAAEKTGRICYGMELDGKYCDVIVERWCKYTGITKIKKNGVEYEWTLKDV